MADRSACDTGADGLLFRVGRSHGNLNSVFNGRHAAGFSRSGGVGVVLTKCLPPWPGCDGADGEADIEHRGEEGGATGDSPRSARSIMNSGRPLVRGGCSGGGVATAPWPGGSTPGAYCGGSSVMGKPGEHR